jgi:hypothetical protein
MLFAGIASKAAAVIILVASAVFFIGMIVVMSRLVRKHALIEKLPPRLTYERRKKILDAIDRFKKLPGSPLPPQLLKPRDEDIMMAAFAAASKVTCMGVLEGGQSTGQTGGNPARSMTSVVLFNSFNDFYDLGNASEPAVAEEFGKEVADRLGIPFSIE